MSVPNKWDYYTICIDNLLIILSYECMSNNLYNSKTIYKRKLHNTKKYVIKKNFPIKHTFRIIIMSVEENSSNTNKSKKSWVWQYFNEKTKKIKKGEESINVLVMIC